MNSTTLGVSQSVTIDSTFGSNGKATYNFNNTFSHGRDVHFQYAGKIVVGGYTQNSANEDFAVVRFNQDGSVDTTFGGGGHTTTNFQFNDNDQGMSLDIGPDSSIMLVGPSFRNLSNNLGYAWYNSDGSKRFQGNLSAGPVFDTAYQVIFQPDDKILFSGFSLFEVFCVARRLTNPFQIDPTFGVDGKAQINSSKINKSFDLLLQTDGKIVSVGMSKGFRSGNRDFSLGRFNPDGTTDSTFGSSGIFSRDFGSNYELALAGAITSKGKILAAGISSIQNGFGFKMIQVSPNGQLDTTFGDAGLAQADFVPHLGGKSLIILPEGKILAVGTYTQGPDEDFVLMRFMPNGVVDSTFGQNGMLLTDFGGADDRAFSVAYDSLTQSIVVVGESVTDTSSVFAIAKYSLDTQVGIEKFPSLIRDVKVYPNPSTSESQIYFYLKSPEYISIDIIDIQGRLVKQIASNQFFQTGDHTLDLLIKDLVPSTYNLQLRNKNTTLQSIRFIKTP